MRTSETAKIRKIHGIKFRVPLVIKLALLIICSVKAFMALCVRLCLASVELIFNYPYALKRVINNRGHVRKFALFPGSTRQGSITRERPI